MSNGMWCMRTLIVLHWFSPQLIPERHLLSTIGIVFFVLGIGAPQSESSFWGMGQETGFVLLTNIGRQRLRRLRSHFQVSNGYFSSIYYL